MRQRSDGGEWQAGGVHVPCCTRLGGGRTWSRSFLDKRSQANHTVLLAGFVDDGLFFGAIATLFTLTTCLFLSFSLRLSPMSDAGAKFCLL